MFKVNPATIKREVARGKLNCFKVGTELRFSQAHIDQYSNSINGTKSEREIKLEKTIGELKAKLQERDKCMDLIKNELLKITPAS
jgi:hypothetical protein